MSNTRRSPGGLDALMKSLDDRGGFTLKERDVYTRGVAIPSYGERYVRDSNVYLLAGMEMYAGEPGAGKSSYVLHVGKQFLRAGGGFVYVETENKFSEEFIRVNMGDYAASERFRVVPVTQMYLPGKKKGRLNSPEREAVQNAWMDLVRNFVMDVRKEGKEGPPLYIGIDSLMGSPSDELSAKVDDGGYSSLQALGPQQAIRVANWYREVSSLLSGTNITVGVSNHLKKAISMDGQPVYGSDIRYPGGMEPKFRSNLVLLFFKGGKEETVASSGRNVVIKVDKNSNGNENRNIRLSFVAENALDRYGDVIIDENMNAFRVLKWKWEESTADVLCRYFDAGEKNRLGPAEYRDRLTVRRSGTQNNYRYTVPQWELENATAAELDNHVNTVPDAKRILNELVLTSVNAHRGVICEPVEAEAALDRMDEIMADGGEGAGNGQKPRKRRRKDSEDGN